MMEAYEVEEDQSAVSTTAHRKGTASVCIVECRPSAQYPKMKKAILKQFNISEGTYRECFRSARMKEGEGYAELNLRLQDLLRRWFEGYDSVNAVCGKVLVEQLLNAMSPVVGFLFPTHTFNSAGIVFSSCSTSTILTHCINSVTGLKPPLK